MVEDGEAVALLRDLPTLMGRYANNDDHPLGRHRRTGGKLARLTLAPFQARRSMLIWEPSRDRLFLPFALSVFAAHKG
jgi:hypothetical protein